MTTPRRTALDSALTFRARLGAEPALADQELVRRFAARAAHVGPAAPITEARTTVKLLIAPDASEQAAAWVGDRGGEVVDARAPGQASGGATTVVLATVPLAALQHVDGLPWVRRVEAARPLLPRLDEARGPVTGLDAAVAANGLSGQGVLVGVIDTGVDWRHADFRTGDGATRVERFVHAHVPAGSDASRFDGFERGQIDAALDGAGGVPDGDPHGHGTHCASIAAGNGRASASQLRGVAPAAALYAMRSEPFFDTHTIRGIRDTFELAGDRPAVVSLSLGGHWGPHDGTSALENEIARASGPGRIVVVAAGNEAADQIHTSGQLVEGAELALPFRLADPDLQFVDVWIPRGDDVDVWLQAPDGSRFAPDGEVHETVFGAFRLDFVEDPVNRDQNLTVLIGGGRVNHRWAVRLRANTVVHGEVHAWAGTQNPSTSAFLFHEDTDPRYSVGMPATEERAVTVGSVISRTRFATVDGEQSFDDLTVGRLSDFSSHGPARYGAQKPDIVAPGQYITAALAAGSHMDTDPAYRPRRSPVEPGPYVTIQGTSMATPFVAGLVALLLEREPRLTPEEVQQRLRITARRDADTGQVWNPGFGYGKVDAQALLGFPSHGTL